MRACSASNSKLERAARPWTRKREPNDWITSSVLRPMEPVEPRMTTFLICGGMVLSSIES